MQRYRYHCGTKETSQEEVHQNHGHIGSGHDFNQIIAQSRSIQHSGETAASTGDQQNATSVIGGFVDESLNISLRQIVAKDIAGYQHTDKQGHILVANKGNEGVKCTLGDEDRVDGGDNNQQDRQQNQAQRETGRGIIRVGSQQLVIVNEVLQFFTVDLSVLLGDQFRIAPTGNQASRQTDDDAPDDEPANVGANLASNGQGTRGGSHATVGQQQTSEDGNNIGLYGLTGNFL